MTQDQIIGKNIKYFREKLDLGQQELANYLDITREEVSYYENGKRSIPTDIISKASQLFGVDEYDFYENDAEAICANVAFAFRADYLQSEDLQQIADFRKIVLNYLNMKKVVSDESFNH
ncbi:MAG: helix-turn-helix transcriptional regulator [Crocinitomicaceae bacterium]|nr:helix-turn-helix transcriptional regulator [Crocinitomicaceae bacterium]